MVVRSGGPRRRHPYSSDSLGIPSSFTNIYTHTCLCVRCHIHIMYMKCPTTPERHRQQTFALITRRRLIFTSVPLVIHYDIYIHTQTFCSLVRSAGGTAPHAQYMPPHAERKIQNNTF